MATLDDFRQAAIDWAVGGDEAAHSRATRLRPKISAAILVEGISDEAALETLAELGNRDLRARNVCVIPMGGATNIGKFLSCLGPTGLGIRVAGLCDAGEERHFRRALERSGFGVMESREKMATAGFFVCVDDLESELIRTLGIERVLQILDAQGDLRGFRTFQGQPAQHDRPVDAQLHRFFGTTAGRKERYARILIEGLDFPRVPQPLADLLRYIA